MGERTSYANGGFALLGVAFGAAITHGVAWLQRRKRHIAYWSALGAEVELCRDSAETYRRAGIIAPLYRLPTAAYEHGFPALLGDGAVKADEAKAVLLFYGLIEQINRGLEQANDAIIDGAKTDHSVKESERLDLKCEHALSKDGPYERVRAVITRHVKNADIGK